MKNRYRVSSKNDATPQIIKQGVFSEELRVKAEAVRQTGVDIPYHAGSHAGPTQCTNRLAEEVDLRPQYYIAKTERNRKDIGALISSGPVNDPAFAVCSFNTHIIRHINSFKGLRSSTEGSSPSTNAKHQSCSRGP